MLKSKLMDIHQQLDLNTFDEDLRVQEGSVARYYRACKLEEKRFLKQKAKVRWLKVGDLNSKVVLTWSEWNGGRME